ncbi:MAG: alpha/beta fold hydrolase [Leptolyngbya sp. LCM1.Bin17]|nr:MAG: alpha/beta fold hydrolase [Leptolyngbya sp. LCM1.Bin17]
MPPPADRPIRTSRLKLPLGTIFWHEVGQGQPVVLLHGTWADSTQWLPVIHRLGANYHCIAPDLLGFGESSAASVPYAIAVEVESLHSLLAALRLGRCLLVGHSLGAWVAVQYALGYPDQVQGVVILEPEGVEPGGGQGRWRCDRALTSPLSPFNWGIRGLSWLHYPRLKALRQRQRQWDQAPAARRLLFQRRSAELRSELVQDQLADLQPPVVVLDPGQEQDLAPQRTQAFLKAAPQAHHQPRAGNTLPEAIAVGLHMLTKESGP